MLCACADPAPAAAPFAADATVAGDAALAGDLGSAPCVTLTVAFAGCDAERLGECQREYAALPASVRSAIDADAACWRGPVYGAQLNATWPATPGVCKPAFDVWEHWFHGGCQGANGTVASAIAAADPCAGTPAACASLTTDSGCTAQQGCAWTAAGACSGQPVACAAFWQPGTQCGGQIGCGDTAFSFCGRSGQPACFFTGTL